MKLSNADLAILRIVAERPMDLYDLADKLDRSKDEVYASCLSLRGRGLLNWMYPEDEIAISKDGRIALPTPPTGGSNV